MKIGIIGAGQLGRMLALAGYPLGLRFVFLDRSADAPGGQVGEIIVGDFDDRRQLAELARRVDVVTFDVENVSADVLREALPHGKLLPPLAALAASQDRLIEKALFLELGIETPENRAVDSLETLRSAVDEVGTPAILKTRRLGYDGRGQGRIRTSADVEAVWDRLGGVPLILEALVPFEREISLIAVRSTSGETAFYPLSENRHDDGILTCSLAPFDDETLTTQARSYMTRLLDRLAYVGTLTIELFVCNGRLLANEIAPRVHNSGHWTIEGAVTSQFENHVRALLGLPLGDTSAVGYSVMFNFIGQMPPRDRVLRIRGAHFHDYGKTARRGRKLGHCTITASSEAARDAAMEEYVRRAED